MDGNLDVSAAPSVSKEAGDTTYEELAGLGLEPAFDRLEAIIEVKRDSGYLGGIGDAGSREHVRFYVELYGDGVLHDVGGASVRVHDIAGSKPLYYAVHLDFEPLRRFCFSENTPRVRAILSWNDPPPAGQPDFVPLRGNRLDVRVWVRPRRLFAFAELLKEMELANVRLPAAVQPLIDSVQPATRLETAAGLSLSVGQKRQLYKNRVPAGRFAYPEALKLIPAPARQESLQAETDTRAALGLAPGEWDDLLGRIVSPDGDTSYEELLCVGLNPDRDMLEAVLTVKKGRGYSGLLCRESSTEHVGFWIDFGDGKGFVYMGSSSVEVLDLARNGMDGIQFAVFLKANLAGRVVPCAAGARVVRLRAILSWEAPPPPGNPDFLPAWGNRRECSIQLRPGFLTGRVPLIETVGGMAVSDIDAVTGLATGGHQITAATVNQSPFGCGVTITGRIGDPPDSPGGGATLLKYRIEIAPDGTEDWQPLTNRIKARRAESVGGIPAPCSAGRYLGDLVLTPADDGDGLGPGWYPYVGNLTLPGQRLPVAGVLGYWETTAEMEGLWKIRATVKNPEVSPPEVYAGNQVVKVRIDNTPPAARVAITGSAGGIKAGGILRGTFSAHDPGTHSTEASFQHYSTAKIEVIPSAPGNVRVVTAPASLEFPSAGTTGIDGTWVLDTTGMRPGGYVLRLSVCDRTNVNSSGVPFCTVDEAGFCLE